MGLLHAFVCSFSFTGRKSWTSTFAYLVVLGTWKLQGCVCCVCTQRANNIGGEVFTSSEFVLMGLLPALFAFFRSRDANRDDHFCTLGRAGNLKTSGMRAQYVHKTMLKNMRAWNFHVLRIRAHGLTSRFVCSFSIAGRKSRTSTFAH